MGRLQHALAMLGACLLLAPAAAVADNGNLPAEVARVARALGVAERDISALVQEVGGAAPLVSHRVDTLRNPASVLKLVTSFAALETLGPAYGWKTEVFALGPVRDGVLHGDLLLKGYGDPFLVAEEWWKLVGGLRGMGLGRITGDLVFDVSHYQLPPEDPGEFDNRPDHVYNLMPHPLLVNFNAASFVFQPGADGRQVDVRVEPELPNVRVQNRLRLGAGACTGYQRGVALNVQDNSRRDRVLLEGSFPSGCREYRLTRTVLRPESYAWGLFDLYWRQSGGELDGQWRWGELADAPAPRLLYTHDSRSLGDLIRLVNKHSNNVMTRQLELTLAAEVYGVPATPERGERAIREVLAARGVDTAGMVLDNAAGLSRNVRVTSRQLGDMLQAAWDSPFMPEFVSSMALSGMDGTLRRRFRNAPEAGYMHLKTGNLNDVSAIAGYVQTVDNRRLVVVLIVNSPNAHRGPGEELQDALLRWAYRQ